MTTPLDAIFAIKRANRMHSLDRITGADLLSANPTDDDVSEAVNTLAVGETMQVAAAPHEATWIVRVA